MSTFQDYAYNLNFMGLMIASIISALSFVVALFWKDAIKETINTFVPPGQGLVYMYLTAVIVTIIVVIIAYLLIRTQRMSDKLMKQAKNKLKKPSKK